MIHRGRRRGEGPLPEEYGAVKCRKGDKEGAKGRLLTTWSCLEILVGPECQSAQKLFSSIGLAHERRVAMAHAILYHCNQPVADFGNELNMLFIVTGSRTYVS